MEKMNLYPPELFFPRCGYFGST